MFSFRTSIPLSFDVFIFAYSFSYLTLVSFHYLNAKFWYSFLKEFMKVKISFDLDLKLFHLPT